MFARCQPRTTYSHPRTVTVSAAGVADVATVSRRVAAYVLALLLGVALLTTGACSTTTPAARVDSDAPYLILDVKEASQVGGAGLRLPFAVRMSDGSEPSGLAADDVAVIDDETGRDFDDDNADGSRSGPRLPADFTLLSVLVLDFSDSVFKAGLQDHIRRGVATYLETLLAPADDDTPELTTIKGNHRLALVQLGRTEEVRVALDFTADPAEIEQAVAAMAAAGGLGTTNLYAGYGVGIDAVTGEEVASPSVQRVVILVTDGAHRAGNTEELRAQALALRERTASAVFTIGIGGGEHLAPVRELASQPRFFRATDAGGVARALQEVAADIVRLARSHYVVGICTPVELGSPTLTLRVTVGELSATHTAAYATDTLDGNTTDCDPDQVAAAYVGSGVRWRGQRQLGSSCCRRPSADAEEPRSAAGGAGAAPPRAAGSGTAR